MKLSPQQAALLSLLVPGLGQLFLGRRQRGGLILGMLVITVLLLLWLPLSALSWLAILPFWALNVLDAYQIAAAQPRRTALLLLLGALPIYVIGWQVTQIDIGRFISEADRVEPVVQGLYRPNLVTQEEERTRASQQFLIPCPDEPFEVEREAAASGGSIETSETCGQVGDTITLQGENFPTDKELSLWWVDPLGNERRIRIFDEFEPFMAEEDGSFSDEIVVPNVIPPRSDDQSDVHRIDIRYVTAAGPWQFTQTARLVAGRMGETIAQALMATFVGALLAMPVSFFGARNLMAGNPMLTLLYYVSRTIMNVLRAIEPLILAIVFVVWVGLGPFAGVLALTVHTIAALGKLYSESIESIDEGPIEAIRATGANQLQIIAYGVVPQVIPPWTAFTVYRWDINVRMSTIIGFVGGGGIGFLLAQWIRLYEFRSAGATIWAIAVVIIVLDYFSAKVRERLV